MNNKNNKNKKQWAAALVLILSLIMSFTALNEAGSNDIEAMGLHPVGGEIHPGRTAYFTGNAQVNGNMQVDGTSTLTGAVDAASTIQYGTNNLYPLGWDSASDKVVCGTTGVFTETTTVDLSGSFSDVDYAVVTQITDPASTGAFLSVDDPGAGTNLVVNSWEADATVGTTGVNSFYCAFGDE